MGVPNLELGYTSVTAWSGDYEVLVGHMVALGKNKNAFYTTSLN
jgi:hypothetical protein